MGGVFQTAPKVPPPTLNPSVGELATPSRGLGALTPWVLSPMEHLSWGGDDLPQEHNQGELNSSAKRNNWQVSSCPSSPVPHGLPLRLISPIPEEAPTALCYLGPWLLAGGEMYTASTARVAQLWVESL